MSQALTRERSDWQHALGEAEARNTVIELRPSGEEGGEAAADGPARGGAEDRAWTVRLYKADDDGLVVQRPAPAGGNPPPRPGETLLGLLVGTRHRWSFRCRVIGPADFERGGRPVGALRLSRPDEAHNAQRRDYFRVDTTRTPLPPVRLWPLLDPASAVDMERHNERMHRAGGRRAALGARGDAPPRMPLLGDRFEAEVLDLSGGGMRITVAADIEPTIRKGPKLWIEASLPEAPAPLYLTARIAHYHPESPGKLCLGLSWCFDHHPEHERFVVDQMCRYVTHLERQQLQRGARRKAGA